MAAVTQNPDITTLDGLMSVIANLRGMEGIVVDRAIHDVKQIEKLELPVFGSGILPRTIVGQDVRNYYKLGRVYPKEY